MNNNIIVTLKSSTTEMNLNSHEEGIYLIPDLEGLTSIPEIRTSSGVNAGADGGWTSAQFFDARSIAMKVVISNEDVSVVEQKRQALNSLLAQGRKEDLLLTVVTEAGNAYTVYVRPTSVSSALNQVLKVQEMLIQFRADDPLIYGEGSSGGEEAILHVQQALGGFAIPFKFPLAIGGGSGATTITNSGSESVYPIITLEGPLHSPTVINRTTNQQIQVLVDLANIINWAGEETAQGNYIQVNNQLDIPAALSEVEIQGNSEQQTYSGKNLLPMKNTTRTINSVTFTPRADGSIALSGTASAQTSYPINVNSSNVSRDVTIPTGSYVVDDGIETANIYVQAFYQETGGSIVYKSGSFTTTAEAVLGAYIRVNSGTNTNGTVVYPMLVSGTVAGDYEPYVGGTASPNPDYPQEIETVTGENAVSITGKNLLSADDGTYESRDIIGVVSNGELTLNGTSTNTSSGIFGAYRLIPAGTYTLSANNSSSETGTSLLRLVDIDGNAYTARACSLNSTNATKTFTLSADTWLAYQWRFDSGKTLTNFKIKPQLELGSTATDYEAFKSVEKEVNLGKNLFDKDNAPVLSNYYIDGTGTIVSGAGNKLTYIQLKPSTTYTLTQTIKSAVNIRVALFGTTPVANATGTILGTFSSETTSITQTFTTTASNIYLGWVYCNTNNMGGHTEAEFLSSIQVECGTQATSYSAYFTPIELCKIGNYQDKIYKSGGKWFVQKNTQKLQLTSTMNMSSGELFTNNNNFTYFYSSAFDTVLPDFGAQQTGGTSLSSFASAGYAVYAGSPATDLTKSAFGWTASGTSRLRLVVPTAFVGGTSLTSAQRLANWKTALGTNDFYIIAPLTTPYDTQITDQALIDQLEALGNTKLYVGQNNITTTYTEGNAQATLKLSYYTDYTRSIDKVVIDSQLQTVTLNGLDIYHQLSESSEFITIAPGENEMVLTSTNTSDEGIATIKFKQGYLSI